MGKDLAHAVDEARRRWRALKAAADHLIGENNRLVASSRERIAESQELLSRLGTTSGDPSKIGDGS